jgi:hypothetical protein
MFFLAKYGVETSFRFPIIKAGTLDFAVTGDWTPATGDTKISKNGGNVANSTNNPAAVGGTGSALWTLTLSATELQASEIIVQIIDSATKAVEDQCLVIYTYGNASAKIPQDWSDLEDIFDATVEGSTTLVQALRLMLSILTGKSSGGGSATLVFRDIGDTKNRLSVTVDSDGNRTAVGTRDGT